MIRGQVSLADYDFAQVSKLPNVISWFRYAQEQLQSSVQAIRYDDLSDNAVFPPIPADGYGVFYTPWGMYSAVTGGVWLRLHTGVTYSPGAVIPTTL